MKPESSLRARALRGSAWTFVSYGVGNLLRLGSTLVLAHVLFPEAFALTALAGIVLQALGMFSDLGIGPAIVRSSRSDSAQFLNTAWTIQAVRGIILWLACVALAWPVASFYDAPDLIWVLPAGGLSAAVAGFRSTELHRRMREMDFGTITLLEFAETLVRVIVTVAWALMWPTVWAIIGGALVSCVLFTIATHVVFRGFRNRFAWDREAAKQILHFGWWVFLSTSMTFLALQSDRLILGWLSSLDILGVYSIAYAFSRLPAEVTLRLAGQVQFPALAEVHRNDPTTTNAKLLASRRLILAVSQFGTLGIIIVSPWFFTQLYDSRYADAAVFAPLLSAATWPLLLQVAADRALLAAGDARSIAFSNTANAFITVISCTIGFKVAGMVGFICGVGLGNLAGHGVVMYALARKNIRIVRQDAMFTALIASVAAMTVGLPLAWPAIAGTTWGRIALGGCGLLVSAGFGYRAMATLVAAPLRRYIARIWPGRSVRVAP
ncbi:MAG: oligosaccharide flippase family protein [Planctomycetota bacterium]|nr:oligosaccharide flippase family protein [Planctomycetota bacterium]